MAKIVVSDACTHCRKCTQYCPMSILYMDENKKLKTRNEETCIECLSCEIVCPYNAITIKPAFAQDDHKGLLLYQ